MEDKECTYIYFRDGSEFITPSLDHAIDRTDQRKILMKCDDGESREIEIQ
jgi:hypothetical protein